MPNAPKPPPRGTVPAALEACVECGACSQDCGFLQARGTPKAVVQSPDGPEQAFACSLCGLCSQVCPLGLDPAAAFLELRKRGPERVDRRAHGRLLSYERRGVSPRYTWRALPEGCDTVFFPGCALPGSRPDVTLAVFERLRAAIPALGIVLDCCTKPSHDLGRTTHFEAAFGELRGWLEAHGVRAVLVACPNCHKVFREHGRGLSVRTVYEVLAEQGGIEGRAAGEVVVHDPCAVRREEPVHGAVRKLAARTGLEVTEMPHSGTRTLCCGEGGGVSHLAPELASGWTELRRREAGGRRILTYCAGCAGHLGRVAPTTHVLDELFAEGPPRVSRPPFTYWNRLRLKSRLQRVFPAAVTAERPARPEGSHKPRKLGRFALLALLIAAIVGLRVSGAQRYLDEATLRAWIEGYGAWGPVVYLAVYATAPSLLLPGLPLTVAAGVLFGPVRGVVYALTGATLGACLAFLVARYAARGWVERKLTDPRWKRLDEEVGRQGWKVVAFTRLVPLFPFNLLNYAFGLTRIGFLPYAVTTLLGMLPACVAFVVFSSSLLDLLKGRVSPRLAVGILLIALVSAAPLAYRKWRGRAGRP